MKKLQLLLLVSVLMASPAYAELPESAVTETMNAAREILPTAKLRDDIKDKTLVGPETEEQKKTPVIPMTDARRVINVGSESAVAAWCGLEWQYSIYLPFMQRERASKRWDDRQIAYIGVLHGVASAMMKKGLEPYGKCSEKQAAHTKARIAAQK